MLWVWIVWVWVLSKARLWIKRQQPMTYVSIQTQTIQTQSINPNPKPQSKPEASINSRDIFQGVFPGSFSRDIFQGHFPAGIFLSQNARCSYEMPDVLRSYTDFWRFGTGPPVKLKIRPGRFSAVISQIQFLHFLLFKMKVWSQSKRIKMISTCQLHFEFVTSTGGLKKLTSWATFCLLLFPLPLLGYDFVAYHSPQPKRIKNPDQAA